MFLYFDCLGCALRTWVRFPGPDQLFVWIAKLLFLSLGVFYAIYVSI